MQVTVSSVAGAAVSSHGRTVPGRSCTTLASSGCTARSASLATHARSGTNATNAGCPGARAVESTASSSTSPTRRTCVVARASVKRGTSARRAGAAACTVNEIARRPECTSSRSHDPPAYSVTAPATVMRVRSAPRVRSASWPPA
jgi:hypothetical protein